MLPTTSTRRPPTGSPGIYSLQEIRGSAHPDDRAPGLLIEVPHGATRTLHYTELRSRLTGDIAADLIDFFHVNTDAGAPEIAIATAQAWVARFPARSAWVLCSEIPRTFIDCNRVIGASSESFREGKVTPGVPPWITAPSDLSLLTSLHQAYVDAATMAIDTVCRPGGTALLLHTYAPRSVDVEVDSGIVANLHHAYLPDVAATWPLRPEVDVIGRGLDGTLLIDPGLLQRLVTGFAAVGITAASGETYPLHPSTWAFHHAARHPGRVLCMEVRRDLVADPFTPFAEMKISGAQAQRIGQVVASGL